MNLGQYIKLELVRKRDKFSQFSKLEHRRDQEDCARSSGACLVNLERFPNEIFSQDWQAGGRSNMVDPAEIALKEIFFGDYGNRTRPRLHIRSRESERIEALPENTFRRRRLLHLGYDSHALLIPECFPERRNRFRRLRHALHNRFGHARA